MIKQTSDSVRVSPDDVLTVISLVDEAADMGWYELQLVADALTERGQSIYDLTYREVLELFRWAQAQARKALAERCAAGIQAAPQGARAASAAPRDGTPGADGVAAQDGAQAAAVGGPPGPTAPTTGRRPASVGEPGVES